MHCSVIDISGSVYKRKMFQTLIFLWLFAALQLGPQSVAGSLYFNKGAPHVMLTNGGLISGTVKLSRDGRPYSSFTGIPYASVPERFAEPQQILEPSWNGVLNATKTETMCAQMPIAGTGIMGEEDCLILNVYVPTSQSKKENLPVMVWVHGGAFLSGNGEGYNPKYFMDEDVIIVSLNYRLSVLGFLSTGDSVVPGNNGLKDIVVALKWVQANIKQFGGDPSLVTVFGESAGGAAVHYLLLSPTTKGLFHRAISQSGSALNPWAYQSNPRQTAVDLATFLKCPTTAAEPSEITSEEILTCFTKLPAQKLIMAQAAFKSSWPANLKSFPFVPTVEPSDPVSTLTPFLSKPPIAILEEDDSTSAEIPWLVGATEDEGAAMFAGFILSNPPILKQLNSDWDAVAPSLLSFGNYAPEDEQAQISQKFKQFYFGDKEVSTETRDSLTNACSDELVIHGVYKAALNEAAKRKRNSVYLFKYSYKGPISLVATMFQLKGEETKKVGHADDLMTLFEISGAFPIPGVADIIKPDSPDEEFSKNFVRLWVSFAIHGEPNHTWGNATARKWKPISKETEGVEPLRWFKIDSNPVLEEVSQSVQGRMKFWNDIWKQHLTPAILAKYKSSIKQGDAGKGKPEL